MKKSTVQALLKIVAILLVVICLASISNSVFARITPDQITANEDVKDGGALTLAKRVATWVRNVSVIAAVIIIMVIGVKYILGSVEEKAEYKKTFLPLIVGIVLVVAATTIATFLFNIAEPEKKGEGGEAESQGKVLNNRIVASYVIDNNINA